jgi:steroid 5-alpha reductase family enzyme
MLDPRSLIMALPAVKTLPECADFSKTVMPYLPQLYDLPQKMFAHFNNLQALQHLYLSTNPLVTALAFALFLTPIVLVVSEINRNYSQVDRLWSLLPVLYNCHYALWAHLTGLPTQRLNHVMAVTILWGARLTFNYWRKGGYTVGSEDYRWEIVKKHVGPVGMFVLNVVFISLAQNVRCPPTDV